MVTNYLSDMQVALCSSTQPRLAVWNHGAASRCTVPDYIAVSTLEIFTMSASTEPQGNNSLIIFSFAAPVVYFNTACTDPRMSSDRTLFRPTTSIYNLARMSYNLPMAQASGYASQNNGPTYQEYQNTNNSNDRINYSGMIPRILLVYNDSSYNVHPPASTPSSNSPPAFSHGSPSTPRSDSSSVSFVASSTELSSSIPPDQASIERLIGASIRSDDENLTRTNQVPETTVNFSRWKNKKTYIYAGIGLVFLALLVGLPLQFLLQALRRYVFSRCRILCCTLYTIN